MNKIHLKVAELKLTLKALKDFIAALSYWRLGSSLKAKSAACDTSAPKGISNAKM